MSEVTGTKKIVSVEKKQTFVVFLTFMKKILVSILPTEKGHERSCEA